MGILVGRERVSGGRRGCPHPVWNSNPREVPGKDQMYNESNIAAGRALISILFYMLVKLARKLFSKLRRVSSYRRYLHFVRDTAWR